MEKIKNVINVNFDEDCIGYKTKDYYKHAIKCKWRIPEICGDCKRAYEDFFLNTHCKRKDVFDMEEKCPLCSKGYKYPHPSGQLFCDKCHVYYL